MPGGVNRFYRLPVTVRVEAMGEAYVGVGNPVDVPDASEAPWWDETVSGSGTQELNVTLTGEPVSFLVALGVAGFGALLLLGAVVLLLTRKREGRDQWQPPRPPASYAQPSYPIQPARPVLTGPAPAMPRPPAGGLYRRLGMAAGIGVVAFSLTGCSIPASVELEQPSRVSLRSDDVGVVMRDWNARSNEAIRANGRGKWKVEAWDQAATGPMLAVFRAATVAAEATGYKQRSRTFNVDAGRVWSVQLGEYPMWAIVEINGGDRRSPLAVYEQQDALSPWKYRGEINVKASAIPTEVEGAAPVSAADAKRVQDVADEIDAYLGKPKTVDGLAGLKKLRAPRREMDAYVAEMGVDTVKTTVEPFDETGPRMVQTREGVFAMLEFTVDSIVGGQGTEWEWNPPFDEFRSQAGKNLSIRTAVMVAVLVPKDGDPSVLGVEYGEILGAKVKI